MADRKRIRKPTHKQREPSSGDRRVADRTSSKSDAETTEDSELGDLIDEIDELLESNAEGFVKSYVQKGGQ